MEHFGYTSIHPRTFHRDGPKSYRKGGRAVALVNKKKGAFWKLGGGLLKNKTIGGYIWFHSLDIRERYFGRGGQGPMQILYVHMEQKTCGVWEEKE